MPDYVNSEHIIENLFPVGSVFNFKDKEYRVKICGKPRPRKGECKTDVYILAESMDGLTEEIKISVKQKNADFLENKISLPRAKEILGENAQDIIRNCVESIWDRFVDDYLICFEKIGKTEAETIKLGWKFELLNKPGGQKSGLIELDDSQKIDIYAGINLSREKRNCYVGDVLIKDSGVANYILEYDGADSSIDECLSRLEPIDEYAKNHSIYFACKALNYRFSKDKWDGPRPLAVYVDWTLTPEGKLEASLIADTPLEINGNQIGERLREILQKIGIGKSFKDLRDILSPGVKIYY